MRQEGSYSCLGWWGESRVGRSVCWGRGSFQPAGAEKTGDSQAHTLHTASL